MIWGFPNQTGIGHMVDARTGRVREKLNSPAYMDHLNDRSVTIAEVLCQTGYRTYLSGKWHVGDARPYWPVERGFMRSFALIAGVLTYFDPAVGPQFGTGPILDGQPYIEETRASISRTPSPITPVASSANTTWPRRFSSLWLIERHTGLCTRQRS